MTKMIKTIKVKNQLRLDELIKYAFDNDVKDTRFESSNGSVIYFDEQGGFTLGEIFSVKKKSTFTVEVEEEIDYDTIFEEVYRVTKEGVVTSDKNKSIDSCLDWKNYQVQIFAMLDGRLQLIWEAE